MKIVVKIFNVLYLVLAAVAITCFCTQPYISVNASYVLTPQQVCELIPKDIKTGLTEDEVAGAIGENGVAVPINVELPAKLVFNFQDKAAVEENINASLAVTAAKVIDGMKTPIHNLAVLIAKKTANTLIYDSILDEISKANPDSDAAALMQTVGIDDAYISDFTDDVFEAFEAEGATVDTIMDVVSERMEDVVQKLKDEPSIEGFDDVEITDEMTETIRESMEESFKELNLIDEDGNIVDINYAINCLLIMAIDQIDDSGDNAESTPTKVMKVYEVRAEGPSEEDIKKKEEELTNKISDLLMSKIAEYNIPSYITDYGFYILIFTFFLMLPWAILALVSFIRILRPKKCWVKTWYVFVFGFIQILLGIGLTVGTTMFLPQIAGLLPLSDFKDVMSSLTLGVKTSSFIPSIFILIMIPIVIIYTIFAHKIKTKFKEEKAAEKAAK